MKVYERIILYVLLLGMAGLYLMHFSAPSVEETTAEIVDTLSSDNPEKNSHKRGVIYYVNTDSIWDEYAYVKDIFNRLETKKSQFEGQLEKQVRDFEREYMSLQEKGRTMSQIELEIKQRDLMKKEAEIGKLKEELEIKFMTEEKDLNDKLRKDIIGFIDDYTREKEYDYVLGYSVTSNIILANDSLDLTAEILNGLNARYAAQNKKE